MGAVTTVLGYSLLLVVGAWLWFHWKKWDFLKAARKLPCPVKTLPLLGHLHLVLQSWEDVTKMALEEFSMAAMAKGLYNVCFWCGPLPFIMIHNPEDIEKILTSSCTLEKGLEADMIKYAIGDGLLTAPVHKWRLTRRYINPLFCTSNIVQLMTAFNHNSRELVAYLGDRVDGETVDMRHPALSLGLKSVCQLIFGKEVKFNTRSDEFKGLMKVVEMVPFLHMKRCVKPWLRVNFIFELLYGKEIKEINTLLSNFTESPLQIAKTNYNMSSKLNNNGGLPNKGALNLIDVYTDLQKKHPEFTDDDLKYEMATLYGTGADTVLLAVSTCLLVLAKYHDIQDQVYNEIASVIGPEEDVDIGHISRLQYLDQVYKETLRWAVPVPYVGRRTSKDIKLSNCTIPAGNSVVVCLVGPLMDPTIYPDPKKFDPERFSPENSASRSKRHFVPFGAGIRMCIGKKYSDILIKTVLVHVLRRYRVSTSMDVNNLKKILAITLVSLDGYKIRFQNRN